jgi:hypothetical protein
MKVIIDDLRKRTDAIFLKNHEKLMFSIFLAALRSFGASTTMAYTIKAPISSCAIRNFLQYCG